MNVKRISVIIFSTVIVLSGIVWFIYQVTFGTHPATPEGVLINDSKISADLLPIIVVHYETDIVGFQYFARRSAYLPPAKNGRGIRASRIEPINFFGITRYRFGTAKPGLFYWQVDDSTFEQRQAQLTDRTVIYGVATETGKSQIPIDICEVIELDVDGQIYFFFYERP